MMKLIKKLELMIMLCACVEGSLVFSSERWPAIGIPNEEFSHLLENSNALELYLQNGGNPNIQSLLCEAVYTYKFDIIKLLLNAGADINLGYMTTPLHIAIINQSFPMVKLLVENGADFSKENQAGNTPIQFANIKLQEHPDDQDRIQIKNYLDEVAAHGIAFNAFTDEIPTAIAY